MNEFSGKPLESFIGQKVLLIDKDGKENVYQFSEIVSVKSHQCEEEIKKLEGMNDPT